MMVKIKFHKLKELPGAVAEHAFLAFGISVFISLVIGGVLFYQYKILVEKTEPEVSTRAMKFEEDLYQKILDEWQGRGERFQAAKLKQYPDPFQP